MLAILKTVLSVAKDNVSFTKLLSVANSKSSSSISLVVDMLMLVIIFSSLFSIVLLSSISLSVDILFSCSSSLSFLTSFSKSSVSFSVSLFVEIVSVS